MRAAVRVVLRPYDMSEGAGDESPLAAAEHVATIWAAFFVVAVAASRLAGVFLKIKMPLITCPPPPLR
jgi:hypothetical protein